MDSFRALDNLIQEYIYMLIVLEKFRVSSLLFNQSSYIRFYMFYLKIEMVISVGASTSTLRSGHVVIILVFFFETFSILFIPTAFQISESRPGLDLFLLPHVPDQPLLFFFFCGQKKRRKNCRSIRLFQVS